MVYDIYAEYALLDAQEKEIKSRKETMREDIIKTMMDQNIQSQAHTLGKFTVSKIRSWTYPEKVIELSEELKAQKALAESTGEATFTEAESLRFTPIKL